MALPPIEDWQALHVHHLPEECPAVPPYLALPPGYRFLIAPGYEDIWDHLALLDVEPPNRLLQRTALAPHR